MDRGSEPPRPVGEHPEDEHTVVSALAALGPLTAPTADERARIRERVLAGLAESDRDAAGSTAAPRGTTPGTTTESPTESPAEPAVGAAGDAAPRDRVRPTSRRVGSGRVARARRGPRGRPGVNRGGSRGGGRDDRPAKPLSGARARFAVAAVAVLALVGSLAGMSLLLARDALPGDALYGVKRTAEAASLGLTFGDESKALKHLDFASARISEIETLARQYPDHAPVGGYLTALTDFDNDASAGSRQLIALATRADGDQLGLLGTWARQQSARLHEVALPDAVRGRESASLALLDKIATRADALLARMDCYQITSGSFDDVGAVPATGPCERLSDEAGDGDPPSGERSGERSGQRSDSDGSPGDPASSANRPGDGEPGQAEPTPLLPPLPGLVTSVLPAPAESGTPESRELPAPDSSSAVELPLPLPGIEVPPLLPGLPGVSIGG